MNDSADAFDLKQRLVDKSIEAYALSLETINRVTIQYRIETFCILICNAWELLLKAKVIADAGNEDAIYSNRMTRNNARISLSLHDCLKKVKPKENDPVRRNIERIIELRDESTHLVISRIPHELMMLSQVCVINYHKHLNEWFGESLSDRFSVGMMSLVYDLSPEQSDLTDARLRRSLGKDAVEFLDRYCAELRDELESHQGSPEFSIGIDYRLVLTNKPGEADIDLSKGSGGVPILIVRDPKDPGTTHPLRQKDVIKEMRATFPLINQYDIQSVNETHKIKSKSEYFYQGKVPGSPSQYSHAFVNWLTEQYKRDTEFFAKARARRKASRKKNI